MNYLVEILVGILLILLVLGQPLRLRLFTHSMSGRIVFLAAAIGASFVSLYAGVLVALIYMTLHKDFMLVESMTNHDDNSTKDFVKKYCKDGSVDTKLNPPKVTFKGKKCNPCDDDCEFEVTSSKERMTVDEALRPKESNSIPV